MYKAWEGDNDRKLAPPYNLQSPSPLLTPKLSAISIGLTTLPFLGDVKRLVQIHPSDQKLRCLTNPSSPLTKASCVHPPHNLILSYAESQRVAGPRYTHIFCQRRNHVFLGVFEFFVKSSALLGTLHSKTIFAAPISPIICSQPLASVQIMTQS